MYVDAVMLGISDARASDLEVFQKWWENPCGFRFDGGGDDDEDPVPGIENPAWSQWDARVGSSSV